jgi:type I restriction enzyme S subunit
MKASSQTLRLEEIAEFTNGGAWNQEEYADSGIPVTRVSDVHGGTVDLSSCKYLPESSLSKYAKNQLVEGDLIICTVGSHPTQPGSVVGRAGIVPRSAKGSLLNQNAVCIRPRTDQIDKRWLGYIGKSGSFHAYIKAHARGSASQVRMAIGLLKEMRVTVPDLPTQRKIAGILSAYDDLIENNLRRIKILEQMAQSLYREWFVHFRFPRDPSEASAKAGGHESATFKDSELGRIPDGWEVRRILDFADVIYGFSFKANRFNTAGEGIPVVRIRNIQDGQSETYTEEEGDPKHRINNGDILVGMDGDFHMTNWSGGDAWQNQRVAKFRPKGAMGNYLLFLALERPIHFFDSTITGTTVAHLGDSHIKTIEFAAPPESLIRKASDLLEPMAQEQLNLRRRNQTLRRTRELLLLKLINK